MPFVIRKVEPRYVSRGHVPQGPAAQGLPVGAELEAVANGALTTSLKQLASLIANAEEIFAELTTEMTSLADRSGLLRERIDRVQHKLGTIDPKKIPVPESDICTFASRTEHFHVKNIPTTSLFKSDTRPKALQELYDAAAIVAVKSLDSLRRGRDGSSMELFMCTPVLSKRRRDKSLDIESRVPAAIEDLRRWTSAEALGDITVPPDCMSRILADTMNDTAVDHKLPSPEEQVQAIAMKFPAEVVAVDVSGRRFDRMSMRRRSLLSGPEPHDAQDATVKRRSRPRRPRGKRRNTIAGTDQREIRQAIGDETTGIETSETAASDPTRAHRSASTDLLESSKKDSPTDKKSHFNTLKSWGMSRLKFMSPKSTQSIQQAVVNGSGSWSEERSAQTACKPDDINIYETVSSKRRRDKSHERKPSSSSSSGKSTSSIPVSVPIADNKQTSVKLRESAVQRRERRKGNKEDQPHSSSGNWSASSESGRASIGSETTTTTHPPRSTTTASIGTSSTSLNHIRRFKGRDTSASSSVTSEGTLTPDIIQDITVIPFSDDGETSSVYSCDTEGYYTSFHMDSGLKTLREEELVPPSPLTKSSDINSDPTSPVVENEYELFGRGSTSTTTSSAGTVCTALLAPPPPERKSSLTVVAMIHSQNQNGGESPDSGHNTSSSPVDSASSPACTGRSCSEFEYSESSDLEGCDRIERIRSKTAINVSRIPSMCIITPPGSDDEHQKETDNDKKRSSDQKKQTSGAVVMSATVGTSKMEVINGQDKNLYATVQTVQRNSTDKVVNGHTKVSPLSGVLEKLRGVLPLHAKKHHQLKTSSEQQKTVMDNLHDSGDYVTIADVRNNNDKRQTPVGPTATYANADLFKKDAEYVSLSELPKKPDSSLERRRQGARVTLDSEGKVVYSSDSLKRRKGAHTTFNPGPFVKNGTPPNVSPMVHRAQANVRAVTKTQDSVDGASKSTPPTSPRLGKLIIRAAKSPERANNQDYIRAVSTVVGPTSPTSPQKQVRGAYVNMQEDEDNALIAISGDSIPVQAIGQQPSYILPSQESVRDQQGCKCRPIEQQKSQNDQKNYCQKQQSYIDVLQNARNPPYLDPNRIKTYDENQKNARQNGKLEHQYLDQTRPPSHQFYTLPSRKLDKEVEPPRSVTPDITRGLNQGPLSAMHLLARHQQSTIELVGQRGYVTANEHLNGNVQKVPNLPQQMDLRNRFAGPPGLSVFGYRFFASSPTGSAEKRTEQAENVQVSFSPIRPENSTGFKSSTPVGNSTQERFNVSDARSPSPVTSANGYPTNIILSPSKSTMSNDELFAAIHKSKKRLNIKDEAENLSTGSTSVLLKSQSGSRHSWSPESHKVPEIPPTTQSTSSTSRMDFKRLLLQQSVKSGPARISAAEQLKMSRRQNQLQQSAAPPINYQQPSLTKVMSPRSAWRFQTPRTDVLSSTIVEDAAAEEKAMKLSPDPVCPVRNRLEQLSNDKIGMAAKDVQDLNTIMDSPKSSLGTRAPARNVQNNATLNICKPVNPQTPAQSASESRRKINQLARAQFLAGAPVDQQSNPTSFLEKRFRARSESPQHAITQKVARSPSAPTLETAL